MLRSQKSELEIQVAKIEESMKAMNSNYRKARKRNDELEDDLKQERHQCQNRVKELEERCAQLEGNYKARTAELRDGKRPKDDDEMGRREKDAMRAELDDLVDDNKSLAQRLIHLESYSDKLSGLVEKHQNEAREAKSRLQKNAENYEKELKAKDREMTEITHRMNKMTKNLQEANENTERLDLKCEQAWERLQELQTEKKSIEEKYVTVKTDLAIVKEAQTTAERRAVYCEENLDKLNKTLIEHANTVRMLQEKIIKLRQEKKVLMQTLDVNKNSHVSSKHQLHESEEAKHLIEQKPDPYKNIESDSVQGKLALSSFPSEVGRKQKDFPELVAENQFLKEQLSHVQRRLADAEDNYDQYLSEVNLCTCRCDVDREHVKGPEDGVQRLQISDLQKQIQQFQRELSAERSERERLEALVNRREEQVDTLRLSFDKSLSAITRDTHNIKNMLGKSLHKIDRQMLVDQGLASNSDITESTSDSSDERALPAKRHLRTISTKSYTSTMGRLQEYRKVNADLRRSLDDRENLRGSPLGSASTSQSQSSPDPQARYACAGFGCGQRKAKKTVD